MSGQIEDDEFLKMEMAVEEELKKGGSDGDLDHLLNLNTLSLQPQTKLEASETLQKVERAPKVVENGPEEGTEPYIEALCPPSPAKRFQTQPYDSDDYSVPMKVEGRGEDQLQAVDETEKNVGAFNTQNGACSANGVENGDEEGKEEEKEEGKEEEKEEGKEEEKEEEKEEGKEEEKEEEKEEGNEYDKPRSWLGEGGTDQTHVVNDKPLEQGLEDSGANTAELSNKGLTNGHVEDSEGVDADQELLLTERKGDDASKLKVEKEEEKENKVKEDNKQDKEEETKDKEEEEEEKKEDEDKDKEKNKEEDKDSIDKSINDLIDDAMSNINIDLSLDNLELEESEATDTKRETTNGIFDEATNDINKETSGGSKEGIKDVEYGDLDTQASNDDSLKSQKPCQGMEHATFGHDQETNELGGTNIKDNKIQQGGDKEVDNGAENKADKDVGRGEIGNNNDEDKSNILPTSAGACIKNLLEDLSKPSEILKQIEDESTMVAEEEGEEGLREEEEVGGLEDDSGDETHVQMTASEGGGENEKDVCEKVEESKGANDEVKNEKEIEKILVDKNAVEKNVVEEDVIEEDGVGKTLVERVATEKDKLDEEDEKTKSVEVKKGITKDLKGFWSSQHTSPSHQSTSPKSPITLPTGDPSDSFVESTPEVMEGVVRAVEPLADEMASIETGTTKKLAHLFMDKKQETQRQGGNRSKEADEVTRGPAVKSLLDKFSSAEDFKKKGELAYEYDQGPSVSENTPLSNATGVAKAQETKENEVAVVAQGTTKNLIQKWKDNNTAQPAVKFPDVKKILEAGKASESGVFENTPEERSDVVKEDAVEDCGVIPPNTTKYTRELWNKMTQERSNAHHTNLKNATKVS